MSMFLDSISLLQLFMTSVFLGLLNASLTDVTVACQGKHVDFLGVERQSILVQKWTESLHCLLMICQLILKILKLLMFFQKYF